MKTMLTNNLSYVTIGNVNIADRFRETREILGMTQTHFAKLMGVDRISIYRWEKGLRYPNGSAIRLLENLRSNLQIGGNNDNRNKGLR